MHLTVPLLPLLYAANMSAAFLPSFSAHSRKAMQALALTKKEQSAFRLGYVTDIEGSYEYFKAFVARSNVLDQRNDGDDSHGLELSLRDNCFFVFGGDSIDKGPGDIRICRALVSLKKRYPDRVFLLVGNRDLNKVRFTAELSDADMARPIDEIPPPHWDPKAPTLRSYLESVAKSSEVSSVQAANTRVERLKYMLLHTLGCSDTFEFRREELSILRGVNKNESEISITDDDVVESFLHEVEHPDGSLRQYLDNANVVAVVGNTLFVHGAVDAHTMKFVPKHDSRFENPAQRPPPGKMCDSLREWVDALNEYLHQGLKDYIQRPLWDEGRTTRGGESLMALQNRPAMWGRSIVSNCYGDGGCITTDSAAEHRNNPKRLEAQQNDPLAFEKVSSDPMDAKVAGWLLKNGIRRVVVGHKPTGDCPAVLSASYTGIEVVSADTSYSDISSSDNRGMALSVVEIVGDSSLDNHLEISGRLSNGNTYHNIFHRLHDEGIDDTVGDVNLGKKKSDGWWIKARTEDQYWLCRGMGRKVEHKSMQMSAVSAEQGE